MDGQQFTTAGCDIYSGGTEEYANETKSAAIVGANDRPRRVRPRQGPGWYDDDANVPFLAGIKGYGTASAEVHANGDATSIVVSPGTNNAAVNPPIEWINVPPGTNAFVLMLYDHVDTLMWAVVNIPGDVRSLPEAIPNGNQSSKLPAGAFHRSFRSNGWIGPAARQNPEGRWTYYWKLFPLDKKLNLPEDASREDILTAMEGHLTGNKAVMITPCCDGSK